MIPADLLKVADRSLKYGWITADVNLAVSMASRGVPMKDISEGIRRPVEEVQDVLSGIAKDLVPEVEKEIRKKDKMGLSPQTITKGLKKKGHDIAEIEVVAFLEGEPLPVAKPEDADVLIATLLELRGPINAELGILQGKLSRIDRAIEVAEGLKS